MSNNIPALRKRTLLMSQTGVLGTNTVLDTGTSMVGYLDSAAMAIITLRSRMPARLVMSSRMRSQQASWSIFVT